MNPFDELAEAEATAEALAANIKKDLPTGIKPLNDWSDNKIEDRIFALENKVDEIINYLNEKEKGR